MKTENVIAHHALRQPITDEQYDQVVLNDKIATALVRRANLVDLEKIAEGVRHAALSSM